MSGDAVSQIAERDCPVVVHVANFADKVNACGLPRDSALRRGGLSVASSEARFIFSAFSATAELAEYLDRDRLADPRIARDARRPHGVAMPAERRVALVRCQAAGTSCVTGPERSRPAVRRSIITRSLSFVFGVAFAAVMLSGFLGPQTPSDSLPADLVAAIAALDRAQVDADTATLARLVTDDYVLVNSDATVDRKPKYLADFLLPGLRMEPYVIEQRIEKAWDGTAVVFGLQRLAWTQDGVRHRRTLRIVHVWTRRSGRWQATHTQLTRVPE
jgi:hypothetical protein